MMIVTINSNDTIIPIKINTAMIEKLAIKNASLGSVIFSINSFDEFIGDDNDLPIYLSLSFIYI